MMPRFPGQGVLLLLFLFLIPKQLEVSLIRYFIFFFSKWIVKNINKRHRLRLKRGHIQRADEILLALQFPLHTFKTQLSSPSQGFFIIPVRFPVHIEMQQCHIIFLKDSLFGILDRHPTQQNVLYYTERKIFCEPGSTELTLPDQQQSQYLSPTSAHFSFLHFILSLLFHIYNLHFITKYLNVVYL